jgi:hypothetical protein
MQRKRACLNSQLSIKPMRVWQCAWAQTTLREPSTVNLRRAKAKRPKTQRSVPPVPPRWGETTKAGLRLSLKQAQALHFIVL